MMRAVALCLLGLCLEGICFTQRPDNIDDFRAFYRAAQLVGTKDGVYSHATSLPDGSERTWFLPYVRMPAYALLLKPLTAFPYKTARVVWLSLLALAFGAAILLFPGPRDKLAIALSFSLPVTYSMVLGQDIAFVVLIGLAASRLALSNRDFLAGLVASLFAIKPTYLLPAGLVFVARSRRGTYGFLLGTAVQLAVSFILEGARWPFALLTLLRHPRFDMVPARMLNVRAITAFFGLPAQLYIVASIGLLIWLWAIARRMGLADALVAALPLGMLASPHSYVYDAVVLIPLLIRTLQRTSQNNIACIIALTPLPYILLMMPEGPQLLVGSTIVVGTTALAVYAYQTAHAAHDLIRASGGDFAAVSRANTTTTALSR